MNTRSGILFFSLFIMMFLFASQVAASEPIAQVFSFQGEVIVQSGAEIFKLTQPALPLKDGDRIQTKQGRATINFDDGAVMKMSPFSNITIRQREEKHGFWIFKAKRAVRRITCFIGKLWFKSGVSDRRNYLQTPTAVCGVRGSEVESGYNNVESLLNVITGAVDKLGLWKEGAFAEPGAGVALKSKVYRATTKAYEVTEKAKATRKTVDVAKARVEVQKVIKEAATELRENPDENVAREAQVESNVAAANVAAGEAEVAVQQLVEAEAPEDAIQNAQAIANNAQEQAAAASEAANTVYEEEVFDPGRLDEAAEETEAAAETAQSLAEEAVEIAEEVAPPEEEIIPEEEAVPEEEEIAEEEVFPEEAPAEEVAPEEEVSPDEAAPEQIPPPEEVPLPDTETPEQEQYQEEASPSQ